MSEKVRFRVSLLIAFGFGLFLAAYPWESWTFWKNTPKLQAFLIAVLPRIGDAFMIAPILAIAIEVAAAQELLKNFALDVSHHIVGRLLPPELREHILGYLTTDFVRRRWFVEYRIDEWPNKPGFIRLTTLSEYELENRSGSAKYCAFEAELDESYFPGGEARICHVSASVDGRSLVEYNEKAIKDLVKRRGVKMYFAEKVHVPPQPHGLYRFTVEYIECLPDTFESPFVASIPVLDTTVRVLYPKNKFKLDLTLSFAEENVLLKTELVDGDQWVVNSPILPGQCLFARWTKFGAGMPLVS